jgi:predicted extracellular nuclease
MGDLNSYAQEDAIDVIKLGSDDTAGTSDDFTNLIAHFNGLYAYSYTFDGQAGYLDHALANASLFAQVTGAADWHINSDEPDVLDYDTSFKPAAQDALYEVNVYRTSDHDPVVVGLNAINFPPSANAGGPYTVQEGGNVTLNATGVDPEGDAVTFEWDLDNNGSFETSGQSVNFSAASLVAPAVVTVKVKVTDAYGNFTVAETTVAVLYNFVGFFQPVDNLPTVNTVKAGQAIPVKFSLSGNHGLNLFAAGYPKIEFTSCTASTVDEIESTVTAGNSSLSYDAGADQYNYVWKTNKAWAGKCGTLIVKFNDGTTRTALFKFR